MNFVYRKRQQGRLKTNIHREKEAGRFTRTHLAKQSIEDLGNLSLTLAEE